MTITNILVPLSGATDDSIALSTAIAAALPFCAHVSALFVAADDDGSVALSDWQMPPEAARQMSEARTRTANELKRNARNTFAACVHDSGAKIAALAELSDSVTVSWRESAGRPSRVIARNTGFADIVVFPPSAGDEKSDLHAAFIHTLLRAERPVLLSPECAPRHVGTKVAVGWDGGLAASHALMAALPFLEHSGKAELLCVQGGKSSKSELAEVREFLALHGVVTAEHFIERTERPIAVSLLDGASRCDLMVVGGYGHSRTLETIFGGVTDHLSAHVHIPILMVH